MPKKTKRFRKPLQLQARIEHGICPECNLLSPLLFLYENFYRCSLCGQEIEQYVNGVIKYIPITENKKPTMVIVKED